MRECRACGGLLPLEDFPKAAGCKEGRRWSCITCRNEYHADYMRRRLASDPTFAERQRAIARNYRKRLALKMKRNPKYAARIRRHGSRRSRAYQARMRQIPEWCQKEAERNRRYRARRKAA